MCLCVLATHASCFVGHKGEDRVVRLYFCKNSDLTIFLACICLVKYFCVSSSFRLVGRIDHVTVCMYSANLHCICQCAAKSTRTFTVHTLTHINTYSCTHKVSSTRTRMHTHTHPHTLMHPPAHAYTYAHAHSGIVTHMLKCTSLTQREKRPHIPTHVHVHPQT